MDVQPPFPSWHAFPMRFNFEDEAQLIRSIPLALTTPCSTDPKDSFVDMELVEWTEETRILVLSVCALWKLQETVISCVMWSKRIRFPDNPTAACLFWHVLRHHRQLPSDKRLAFAWNFRNVVGFLIQDALV